MGQCNDCIHYITEYSHVLKGNIPYCELPKRNKGCVGNYEFKGSSGHNKSRSEHKKGGCK